MSETPKSFESVKSFFDQKISDHGPVPAGLDCRDHSSVTIRYDQILKVIEEKSGFSILDYGCGYGGLAPYMQGRGFTNFEYIGRDFSSAMIESAIRENSAPSRRFEVGASEALPTVDYIVASGVFNMKLDSTTSEWQDYALNTVKALYNSCKRGAAVNFLTGYSDADRKRPDLFYPRPEEMFSFGKSLSRNVALLHDYEIYDFTLIIRRPTSERPD